MEKLKYERPFIKKMIVGMLEKSGTSSSSQPVTHIDGVSVKELIAKYGSPVFVMSETQIRSNYQSAVQAFSTRYPKVQFAWSYKTHYNNAICRIFHQEGSWAEVVSGFEYRKALSNGVSGSKIIFNGPDKSDEDLRLAVSNGSMIHIDHLEELYVLIALCKELSKKAQVAIRVNMDTGVYPIWDRFGFNFENGQAWAALEKINTTEVLELTGLHAHIGTYMLSSMADGKGFRLILGDEDLSSQEAADILHVSRPFLIKLLEQGQIPFQKVGKHRRVKLKDLHAYEERQQALRNQQLDYLAQQAQELNMGY